MNDFLKENLFKLAIVLAILVGSISLAYYFVFYLPEINEIKAAAASVKQEMEHQQKCREVGQKAYEEDKKLNGENLREPQFSYNAELNTCLYGGGYTNTYKVCEGGLLSYCTRGSWERFVRDAYTNQDILAIFNHTSDGRNWTHSTEEIVEFENQYNELMGFQE